MNKTQKKGRKEKKKTKTEKKGKNLKKKDKKSMEGKKEKKEIFLYCAPFTDHIRGILRIE